VRRQVGDAAPPSRRLGYQPALDGIRALAIAPVVGFHAFGWPQGGVLGVHMFFVLSGFLITALLLQEWNGNGSISLRHFYFRRALRLFPALAAMLAIYVVIQTARELVIEPGALKLSAALEGVLYSAFYISNIVQAFGTAVPIPLIPLWSLATEEQFYLIWPVVLVWALRTGLRPRVVEAALVVVIAVIIGHRVWLSLSDASIERLYYAPDTSFDTILVGCLFALWFVSHRIPRPLRSAVFSTWAWVPASLFIAVTMLVTTNTSPAMYWGFLAPFALAVAVVILSVVSDTRSRLARALSTAPFVFVGRISYSLYLWHLLIIYFGQRVGLPVSAGIALSVLVATLSYYAIELPFLRRKRRDRAAVEAGFGAAGRTGSKARRTARRWGARLPNRVAREG
jgi:peptidoglycan/LPS O-acetylase OafA/YrhL